MVLAIAFGDFVHDEKSGIESERSEHCEHDQASSCTDV